MTEENTTPAPVRGTRQSRKIDYRDPQHRRKPGDKIGKLHAKVPDHLVGYWVLDRPGRVQSFIERGWKFAVESPEGVSEADNAQGSVRLQHALTNEKGESEGKYLMLIPREIYEQDRSVLWERQNEIVEQMEGARFANDLRDSGYIPNEGISVPKGKG